jgi:N-acetylglucosaminyldiphosphoundecaprenol N-acetyl-beta-D-mannosaminyltransferase
MLCCRDEAMAYATAGSDLTLPDGVGIVLAATVLGYPHSGRIAGPELMLDVCDRGRSHNLRHFLYGGKDGIADALARRLQKRFPGLAVAGTYCPPFRHLTLEEDRAVVKLINDARPDIVWAGLGAPKQEKWMATHRGRIQAPVMVGVGAAFDFHSQSVKRAPQMMREMGLEWLHRLFTEPRRMWRRNLDGLLFFLLILRQKFTLLRSLSGSRKSHSAQG